MRPRAAAALLVGLSLLRPVPAHAQFKVWIIEYRQAIDHYRHGRTGDALALLQRHSAGDWDTVVDVVVRQLEEQAVHKEPLHILGLSALENERGHNLTLARSAAALHMEEALSAYQRQHPSRAHLEGHVDMAVRLFAFVARQDGQPTAAPAWELAIGLTAAADGRFGWAAQILDAACRRFPGDGPLQLARGSVHETIAGMPAAQLATGPAALVGRGFSVYEDQLSAGRGAREARLDTAREAFERALAAMPGSAEARLRLARVRALGGDVGRAVPLLADVVEGRVVATPREGYLARLFLGRLRERENRLDEADALFTDASTMVPGAQSPFVARADIARRRGDAAAALAVTERLLATPRDEDPWTGYRFAQYFVRDTLLARLRAEARQ